MSKNRSILAIIVVLLIASIVVLLDKQYRPVRKGLDIAGGVRVVFQAEPGKLPKNPEQRAAKMQSVLEVMRKRSGGIGGVVEPVVHLQGDDRVVVELPGVKNPEEAVATLRKTASLEFYWLKDVKSDRDSFAKWEMSPARLPEDPYTFRGPGDVQIDSNKEPEKVLSEVVNAYDAEKNPGGMKPILTGEYLRPNAKSDLDPQDGAIILIEFNKEGSDIFREFTQKNTGRYLAIFYDGKILTAPVIKDVIPNGEARISGFANVAEAQNVADTLNSGALPVPLQIEAYSKVEATLGRETVNQVLIAGIVGLAAVMLFMIFYYRLPGFIAALALVFYAVFTFAAYKLLGATMSLPAIAAFVLSVGMAVDANILIFERLKEELNSGKTLKAAIDAGFSRAFTAIFDSNVCTAITCLILYYIGTGTVQSFAISLVIGVAISMFTAITVTRTILHLLVNWEWAQNAKFFGLGTSWFHRTGRTLNIVGKRKYYYLLSLVLIVPGMIVLLTSGFNKGIEFSSGTMVTAQFEKNVTISQIQKVVDDLGVKNSVQISEGKTAFITTNLLPGKNEKDAEKLVQVQNALKEDVGTFSSSIEEVGATISNELTNRALIAVLVSSALIILYLTFRFAIGGLATGFKYGVCAVIALIHDAMFIAGSFAIFGKLFGWQIDSLFVTAVLTIIGFSVHDTIVVYDRIRENLRNRARGEDFETIANNSILQTFSRSINTSVTVMLTLSALLLFGGPILKHFYVALFLGIVVGVYSSVFVAVPFVIDWERLFGRSGTPKKQTEGKTLVGADRVRLAEAPKPEPAQTAEQASVGADSDRVRVKPKKKKKRF